MKVLVVDVGGTSVKILATGQRLPRRFRSGKTLTPEQMVSSVKSLSAEWKYDVVAMGYPGVVSHGRPKIEPHNLAPGWVGFNYAAAFGCPVRILNDAAMQALGSYRGGLMLFVGFGTGLGSAIVTGDTVIPMELGHLSYLNGTCEDYVGVRGIEMYGVVKWRAHVTLMVARLIEALHPDDIVLGGGNAKRLRKLPPDCRLGDNTNAFIGGFRMWESPGRRKSPTSAKYVVQRFGIVQAPA